MDNNTKKNKILTKETTEASVPPIKIVEKVKNQDQHEKEIQENEELQKYINKGHSKNLCEDMNKIQDKCKESKSFKKNLNVLKDIINESFENTLFKEESKKNIKILSKKILSNNKLINLLSPSGTKGKFTGAKLEELSLKEIENIVNKLGLNQKIPIHFQENNEQYPTPEIPDIWIQHEDKTIIFMIQKDLWGGGHQSNRCEKYLNNNKYNNNNVKLICVVSEYLNIDSFKNKKIYDLLCKSIKNKKLCWINHLEEIIIEFFNIKN